MKKILEYIPIIGKLIRRTKFDPKEDIIWGSYFLEWYLNDNEAAPVREWAKQHPNQKLTQSIIRDILAKNK